MFGVRPTLRPRRKPLLDPLAQSVEIQCADHSVAFFALVQQDQGGDTADPKPLLQAGRQVSVDLDHLHLTGQLLGQPLDRWRDDPAGPAPGSPEVDEDRDRALLGYGAEVRHVGFGEPRERPAALRAVWDTFRGRPDARLLPAVGARDDLGLAHFSYSYVPVPSALQTLSQVSFPPPPGEGTALERSEQSSDDTLKQIRRGVDAEPDDLLDIEAFVRGVGGHPQSRPGHPVLARHLRNRAGLHVKTRPLREIAQDAVSDLSRRDDLVSREDDAGFDGPVYNTLCRPAELVGHRRVGRNRGHA